MADGKIRRVVTTAALAAVPVLFFAAPASAQSGAGGSLHQIGAPWHQSGAGGSLHQDTSADQVADAGSFDARF